MVRYGLGIGKTKEIKLVMMMMMMIMIVNVSAKLENIVESALIVLCIARDAVELAVIAAVRIHQMILTD